MHFAHTCRRFVSLLAVVSSLGSAQAAEVSPAQRVETTPGLTPEAVRRAFDSQRQALSACMRLVEYRHKAGASPHTMEFLPWNAPPDADDRIQLRLTLTPDGKLHKDFRRPGLFAVRALYLDTSCAENVVSNWTFPTFPGEKDAQVQVEVWARFRTTEAERTAALTRIRADYAALCRALLALGSDNAPPSREQWNAGLKRFLSERGERLAPRVRRGIEAVANLHVRDAINILESGMAESTVASPECQKLQAWKKAQ
ncbi:hypothetical protein [Myxococcus sp. Y35]|uniref:hypothetical protein n=1 Tax=Pseudomyxococcus flavus TaxID=3115648 RepID=UPI003CEE3AA2